MHKMGNQILMMANSIKENATMSYKLHIYVAKVIQCDEYLIYYICDNQ